MIRILQVSILLIAAAAGNAQNVSCLLSGTVHDQTEAVVRGAEIRLVAASTGFVRTTATNNEGFFSFPDLTPSTFDLSVSMPGFKSYSQTGITISSGEQRSVGVIQMELGVIADTISVTADAVPVMAASGERAGVLMARDLSEMAIKGRDFMDAVALLPGVVDTNEGREAPYLNSTTGVFIAGSRDSSKSVTVDGVANTDVGSSNGVVTMPSVDSVAELKVLMSNYAAEYGRNSGGTITIITKGGQRQFHATGGWYHRHEGLSANDYFNNRNGVARPRYRYNIFSYTLSGPIYIPGKFNTERSKLFFFFSQEFQEQLYASTAKTVTVPTALERAGDFSKSFDTNGKLITIYDPTQNKTPFPGNIIPAARFSRVGQHILNLFPLPNFVDPAPSRVYQWNYISAQSFAWPRHTEIARVDYSPRQNVQIYGRLSNTADESQPYYGQWVNGSVNFPLVPIVYRSPGRGGTVHSTITISPSVFSEFVFGVTQNNIPFFPATLEKVSRTGTGIDIPQWFPGNNPLGLIPDMTFGGVANPANPTMEPRVGTRESETVFNFVENLSKVHGTHTLKFGFYAERARFDKVAPSFVRGQLSFARDTTNSLDTNYAYSNALLGMYTSYTEATTQPRAYLRFTNFEWYAQDDWRIRPGLFLNYGLRFYHDLPRYDRKLQAATFVTSFYDRSNAPVLLRPALDSRRNKIALDPTTGNVYPGILVGTFVPGVGNPANGMAVGGKDGFPRTLYTTSPVVLGPRLGFSWDPFGKGRTTIRGGGGIFYNRIFASPILNTVKNPPTVYTPTAYYGTVANLAQMANQGLLAPAATTYSMFGSQGTEGAYNYSFGVQQQFARRLALDVSYVGSLGRHFNWARNINPVPMGARFLDQHPENRDLSTANSALSPNFLRAYQGWGDIMLYEFGTSTNYHSLQVSASRRTSRGLVAVGYTFSKVLGTCSGDYDSVNPFFAPRRYNYGPLNYDRTHVLTLRYNYTLPRPGRYFRLRSLGAVTDHWEISGVSRFISGAPFTPGLSTVDGQDITGTPSLGARPDVASPSADPVHRFGRPVRGSFGNVGPNVLRGPGTNSWDISLYRRIPIGESRYVQVRFESYNTFNHTQFSSVSTSARFDLVGNQVDPLFLQPTATRSPRRVQLAMRFQW